MTNEIPINDDELKRLMQSVDEDAAPIDEQRMQDAIAAATEVFESQVEISAGRTGPTSPRRHLMLILAKPLAVVTAAAAALLVVLLPTSSPAVAGRTSLGDVLDNTLRSTIELRVVKDTHEDRVWVQSGSVRWETTPQQYRIAAGSRLWEVDETKGKVTSSDSKWWTPKEKQVDLLALLGARSSEEIRRLRPIDTEHRNGVRCHVYEFTSEGMIVRVWADTQTNTLHTVAAWADAQLVKTQPPLSELRLVKRNIDIDESRFVVGGKLSVDGRTGRIIDHQGIVSLRPLTRSRWTPVAGSMLVKPGDWLRTDVRGANAATVELVSNYRIIVGPGSLVELAQPHTVVLHYGEVQIVGSAAATTPVELIGPDKQAVIIQPDETALYRLTGSGVFFGPGSSDISNDDLPKKTPDPLEHPGIQPQPPEAGLVLKKIEETPSWLAGYEGSSTEQSIGSLIANVDGRNTPLTVGYHKVNVEIRDQIARTTIEESFVNHTNGRLEGTFHFPLPQDASISGFGMWIGGELIEADVVEKQRAREIYETILRENRDPGLLEWTGGNIFKARVFPIEPHSEKRIKIVYTQVLPLRAQKFRYSYGLRSELLQKHPLRELSVSVLVNSTLPLKAVTCATHPARVQQTEHSGRVEFSAQEYTPERDFEIVCELETQQSDVIVVPHQRGDDGYFLAQVMPPSVQGNWQRDVLPDGSPLDLLLVCDTSGSMDSQHRDTQQQFVLSMLNALGPEDRFNMAVCDVECEWKFEESVVASEDTRRKAMDWLEERRSLGWTDLDAMGESVSGRLTHGQPHVIYIGDGIVTAGDADAQAFIGRWKRKMKSHDNVTFHAVSVGSSFESTVLKAIASVGGGSVRQVNGEQTPVRVARELLNEIAQPGLQNLKVEFTGIQVAAVYPQTLPNLAAGTQQIIVGRYLPDGAEQTGQMIVTGLRDGEPVKYVSKITVKDAEHGNSFIPRLWARVHLDHLLEQGTGSFIREQIIAMSEEFHIITPYTSLLVLETDADRERFGVKRRFLMRDGERFFADGRSSANFELVQQQMKAAGDWRLGMRMQILQSLSGLGRRVPQVQQIVRDFSGLHSTNGLRPGLRQAGQTSSEGRYPFVSSNAPDEESHFQLHNPAGLRSHTIRNGAINPAAAPVTDLLLDAKHNPGWNIPAPVRLETVVIHNGRILTRDGAKDGPHSGKLQFRRELNYDFGVPSLGRQPFAVGVPFRVPLEGFERSQSARRSAGYTGWFNQLFPVLPASPETTATALEADWSEDALAISKALVQPLILDDSTGLDIRQLVRGKDPVWKRQTSELATSLLYSTQKWLAWSHAAGRQTIISWCDDSTRGAWSTMFDLGRTRKSTPKDVASMTPGNRPFAVTPLHQSYHRYTAKVLPQDGDVVTLVLTPKNGSGTLTIHVDTNRNIVLRTEWEYENGSSVVTEYSDHVQIAGIWWPQTIRSLDAQGRETSSTKQTVKVLNEVEFTAAMKKSLPPKDVRLIAEPLPTYREAKIATESGTAEFDHHLVLLLDASTTQDWDEVLSQLESMEATADGQPGIKWIRQAVLRVARRNEEARQVLHELAQRTLEDVETWRKGSDPLKERVRPLSQLRSLAAAQYIMQQRGGDHNEQLTLLGELQSVYESQPADAGAMRLWKQHRANLLRNLSRVDEVLPLRRELAESAPWDIQAQQQYAESLHTAGEHLAARTWLREQLDRPEERKSHERYQLRDAYANFLRRIHRPDELVAFMTEWLTEKPVQSAPYQMYLSALISADRTADANTTASEWLTAGQVAEKHDPVQKAQVTAAISYAQGQYYNLGSNRFDPQWLDPLLGACRFWLPHDHHFDLVTSVLGSHRFSNSDQADLFRSEIAGQLMESVAELSLTRLRSYISWTQSSGTWSSGQWRQLEIILRQRWQAEEDQTVRRQLGDQLTSIHGYHSIKDNYLPFLRIRAQRERETGDLMAIGTALERLFNALIQQPWSIENETEGLSLLPQLAAYKSTTGSLLRQVQHLHRLVDAMLQRRDVVARQALQADGHPEELTRTELAKRYATIRRKAMEGLVASLETGRAKLPLSRETPSDVEKSGRNERLAGTLTLPASTLRDWLDVERMYLNLRLGRNQETIVDECWKLVERLNPDPAVIDEDTRLTSEQIGQVQLAGQLRNRAMTMIEFLAVQRSAPKTQQDRLKVYFQQQITTSDASETYWKSQMITLLIALDKPDELERQLKEWIRGDEYPIAWQLMLGRLLAEQGQLNEAIALFEGTQRRQQLSAADHSLLADWYMATDRRDDYERSRVESFEVIPEHQLQQWIGRKRRPWEQNNTALPTELDEDVLFAFQALFRNSREPGNYVYELKRFYTACRDFRLLNMIPDSVVGRTPQQVYSFLNGLNNYLLHEVRNEATVDEIIGRIKELQAGQELTGGDLRALDLLEAIIERRAADVLNQPGPHVVKAVAALKRAFERDWADGEERQMAPLLGRIGRIGHSSHQALKAERLRQLQVLHDRVDSGSGDRVVLAEILGQVLFHSHKRKENGLAVQAAAIREYEQAHPDGWPAHLNNPLWEHLSLLEFIQRYAAAESVLDRHIAAPANPAQLNQFVNRRHQTWLSALRSKGRVSLGSGQELYRNILAQLLTDAATGTDNSRYQALRKIAELFGVAKTVGVPFQNELRTYAAKQFPALIDSRQSNYGSLVSQLAQTLHTLMGADAALEFLVTRMEQYPARLELQWQNSWQQHVSQLGKWRHKGSGNNPALQSRVLALVLKELRRDLTTREQVNRVIYNKHHRYFWTQKTGTFAATAESVLKESSSVFTDDTVPADQRPLTTGKRTIVYAAQYLYNNLERHGRAIEIMLVAHQHELLDVSQQIQLCRWLHSQNRHAESIPLLEPIVESHPDVISYRVQLLKTYHHSDRPQQRDQLLADTDAHFRQPGRWTEANIAALAKGCVNTELNEQAIGYYNEVIPLHQRTQPNRGIGNGTLANYYRHLARSCSKLGRTKQAVDAASAAVISWGRSGTGRQETLSELRQVFYRAGDLDEYVVTLDADSKSTGQDSPLIRKQIGIVYQSKGECQKAIVQLKKAIALQPHDLETHHQLLECYDKLEDPSAGVEQLLTMIDIDRHNLKLYIQLAERLKDDPQLSERATTSLVEAGVTEAENHQALAELRQKQDRWPDAIQHWQHVARLRSLEPTGLVHLAKAQIHEQNWPAARESVKKLTRKEWPGRFGNVQNDIRELQQLIP